MAGFSFKRKNEYEDDFSGENDYWKETNGLDDDAAAEEGDAFGVAPTPVEPTGFGTSVSLKIVNPKGYKDASEVADYLMNGNTVLLNIEGLDPAQAMRLLDYLAGATHAVGGLITKVGRTTIVVAPKNVDVSSIEAMVSAE